MAVRLFDIAIHHNLYMVNVLKIIECWLEVCVVEYVSTGNYENANPGACHKDWRRGFPTAEVRHSSSKKHFILNNFFLQFGKFYSLHCLLQQLLVINEFCFICNGNKFRSLHELFNLSLVFTNKSQKFYLFRFVLYDFLGGYTLQLKVFIQLFHMLIAVTYILEVPRSRLNHVIVNVFRLGAETFSFTNSCVIYVYS